ncbi:hypothetical protein ACFVTF_10120 [Kitasatospora sp. NPDC057940]|uniref:hypothetical protein n=1 Tax=Kitasatospora sp. NPDC057940 TaxID=3346285 RepID=UPI0036DEF2EC
MGIGYLLLYVALAVVALWLVAEVLLQNRAPLHWRALALVGFLGVAAGMVLGSVPVIGAGAALFAAGQTFVTLSVKRGYRAGWSLRKADGSLPGPLAKVPLLGALTGGAAAVAAVEATEKRIGEVSAVEEAPVAAPDPVAEDVPEVEQTASFEMQELAQDGVYAPAYYEQQQAQAPHDPYAEAYQSGYDNAAQPQPAYEQQQWQSQQQPAFAYDQGYGAYPQQSDPYSGYPQQDQYQSYPQQQQPGWEQHPQQQWQTPQQHPEQHLEQHPGQQPGQHPQGIPQQQSYDHTYGYQQQNTWPQG